jgi:DNA-binding CsgD family transcriptional regulator
MPSHLHPWFLLLEASSFPDNEELLIMKGVMDGRDFGDIAKEFSIKPKDVKLSLAHGMQKANVNNLYELIVWGLRTGIIKDEPIKDIATSFPDRPGTYDAYPGWLKVLNATVKGEKDKDIDLSKDSIKHYRDMVAKKFNLDSQAKFIRFAFAAVNPISGPSQLRILRPFVPSAMKMGGLKYPPMLTKFRPANIDPNIPVYDPIQRNRSAEPPAPRPKLPPGTPTKKLPPPVVRSTSVQTALYLLGIDKSAITPPAISGSFWNRPSSYLWNLLELAKKRYEYEIRAAHPDLPGGNVKRAQQLTAAWRIVKELFKRRGYSLDDK